MAITNYDGIISNRAAGNDDDRWIFKTGTLGGVGFQWYWFGKSAGYPSSVTLTDATSGGAIMNATSVGAVNFSSVANATSDRYLLTVGVMPGGAEISMMGLIDVLWAGGSIQVTESASQTISSPALTRSTDGKNNMLGLTVATNLISAAQITIYYTDAGGTATSTAVTVSTAGGQGRFLPSNYFGIPLPNGIKSVNSVQINTTQSAGAVDIMIFRPLTFSPCLGANIYTERDIAGQIDAITLLRKDSSNDCGFICPVAYFTGTTARGVNAFVRTVSG